MLFNTTITIPITQPEFPEFITKFNPEIKTPYYHELTAIYKPASQEFILLKNGDEIARDTIKNNQVTLTVSIALKALVQEYVNYVFFYPTRLFEWFAKQDQEVRDGFPITTRLILESYYRKNKFDFTTHDAVNNLPEGITHPTENRRIIRENDDFIILSDGYLLRLTIEDMNGLLVHYVTQQALLKPTIETYQECYEIGKWLELQSNNQ